jgi:8-oxo-dGTP pyrophosphatase MutT (NUDIX family)
MKPTIPPHAEKVFEGVIFDIYHWEQELFDQTTKTFELATRPSIVAVIATRGNTIFIAQEEQPGRGIYLALPAGLAEKYDTDALATAQRELREETGLTTDDWELFTTQAIHPRLAVTDYVYIARNVSVTHPIQLDPGERIIEQRWVTLDELIDTVIDPTFMGGMMTVHMMRAKYDPAYKQVLEKLFFGDTRTTQ